MDVTLLNTGSSGGNLLLRSLFGPSYFANITVEALPDGGTSGAIKPNDTFLRDWEISRQFPRGTEKDFRYFLKEAGKSNKWQNINDPDDDYVNLCRYFEHPDGIVVSRKGINTSAPTRKNLHFDFGGKLRILLNGEEIFNYSRKYKFERTFDGTFSVALDLKKGNNQLVFITEGDAAFFPNGWNAMGRLQHQNWGFIARLEEMK